MQINRGIEGALRDNSFKVCKGQLVQCKGGADAVDDRSGVYIQVVLRKAFS